VENDHYRYGLESGSRSGQRFILWLIRDKRGVIWRYVGGNPVIYYRRKDAAEAAKKLDSIPGYRAVRAELTLATNSGGSERG
jgi:hypothetical protein